LCLPAASASPRLMLRLQPPDFFPGRLVLPCGAFPGTTPRPARLARLRALG
jgi:hypothetical protein